MLYAFSGILRARFKPQEEAASIGAVKIGLFIETTVSREWYLNQVIDVFITLNLFVHMLSDFMKVLAFFQAIVLLAKLVVPIALCTERIGWKQALAGQCFLGTLPQLAISLS